MRFRWETGARRVALLSFVIDIYHGTYYSSSSSPFISVPRARSVCSLLCFDCYHYQQLLCYYYHYYYYYCCYYYYIRTAARSLSIGKFRSDVNVLHLHAQSSFFFFFFYSLLRHARCTASEPAEDFRIGRTYTVGSSGGRRARVCVLNKNKKTFTMIEKMTTTRVHTHTHTHSSNCAPIIKDSKNNNRNNNKS